MRNSMKELVARQGGRATTRTDALALPMSGLNEIAAPGTRGPTEAAYIMNLLPYNGDMRLREGYTVVKTRTAPVSMLGYVLAGGEGALAVDGAGWVLSLQDDGTIDTVGLNAGLSSSVGLVGAMNSDRLCVVDGVNAGMKLYTGSGALTSAVFTGDYAGEIWSGVTAHQRRLFFWKNDSLDFWYLDNPDSIQGEIVKFELSFLGRLSGTIATIASWSTDAGQGTNDLFAVVTTTGDVAIYEGTDPGDPLAWRLNGVYQTSQVSGADTWVNVGGDLRLATKMGVVSFAELLNAGELAATVTSTPARAVAPRFQAAGDVTGKGRYWQSFIAPDARGVWFNLPTTTGVMQIVFSTETSRCFLLNLPAVEFAKSRKTLWFSTVDGKICRYGGYSDGGAYIVGEWHSDWVDSRKAAIEAVRMSFECATGLFLDLAVNADLRPSSALQETMSDTDVAYTNETEVAWRIRSLDGIADDEIPVENVGDRLQIRARIENRYFEDIRWKTTDVRRRSLTRSR